MKASVEVICYKVRPLKNGEFPLMLRITQSRKRKYVSIGISIDEKYWDFSKNKPKRNCPNKEKIEKLIASKINEYNNLIVDLTTEQREYTAETLVSTLNRKNQFHSVDSFYEYLINKMKKDGKLGNADVYKYSLESLLRFTRNKHNITFKEIDTNWLKRYEDWLRANNNKDTTISQLFRTLRSVFNKAIEQELIKSDCYPFNKFKISKFDTSTQKRAICKDDLLKVMQVDLSKERFYMNLSRDIFVFSYLSGGINFADIAYLTNENICNDRLEYKRQKTAKKVSLPLHPDTSKIISQYADNGRKYLFPILDEKTHKTPVQRYNRIHKVLKNVNYNLKILSTMIGLNTPLTTYVARHTYATVLKRSGVNIAIISESLGHSDLATTQIYLDSFENSQIDEAMKNLL